MEFAPSRGVCAGRYLGRAGRRAGIRGQRLPAIARDRMWRHVGNGAPPL